MRLVRDRRGTALAELAIVMPILMALVIGIMVFGQAYWAELTVSGAAREGARLYAVNGDTSQVRARVVDSLASGGLRTQPPNFSPASDIRLSGSGEEYIWVAVTYRQPTIIPGLGAILGGSPYPNYFSLTAKAVFRNER